MTMPPPTVGPIANLRRARFTSLRTFDCAVASDDSARTVATDAATSHPLETRMGLVYHAPPDRGVSDTTDARAVRRLDDVCQGISTPRRWQMPRTVPFLSVGWRGTGAWAPFRALTQMSCRLPWW